MKKAVCLRFLGTVLVERDGKPVRGFRSRKALALLGYLALQEQPISRERLVDLFWEDKSETQGRANLSWVLGRISSLLPGCLAADRHTVQFKRGPLYWLDVDAFEELEARGEPAALNSAVALCRGEFLEGMYLASCVEFELWLVKERECWRQRTSCALDKLLAYHSQRGEYDEGLRLAHRLLALEPWREGAHRQLMQLLAWSGQRAAALAQYESCRRALAEELGVEPAAETTQIYALIRDGELATLVSAPVHLPDFSISFPSFLEDQKPVEGPIFVAREQELARLGEFLDGALAGRGQIVFVTGEAGQGKTALIQEFARQAQAAQPDLVVVSGSGNAYTGPGDPYLPFRELLGLLTGDVEARWAAGGIDREQARRLWNVLPLAVPALVEAGPDLIDTFLPGATLLGRATAMEKMTPGGVDWLPRLKELVARKATLSNVSALQQSDLFEQYARVLGTLAQERPLVLVLDDLQWVDAGSANLLFHLGQRAKGSRMLIVGAYRPAEVAVKRPSSGQGERHPLASVVNELERQWGDIKMNLEEAEGRRFIDALLDAKPCRLGNDLREALYGQTRGHPLFTVELLEGMRERGELIQDQEGYWVEGPTLDWGALPTRVEAVIVERLSQLPESLRQTLQLASVEGETFTAEVLAQVQGTGEREMVECLSRQLGREHRLAQAQGLQRLGTARLSLYRFRHILFQRYLYNSLDPVERAHLHEQVGMALEALYGEAREEMAALAPQLARHFVEAGLAEKAIGYLHQAGDRARGLYALKEAIDHYQRALALLKEQKAREQTARTLMKLGLTFHLAFDFQGARQAFEEGFLAWQRMGEAQAMEQRALAPHAFRVDCPYPPVTLDPSLADDVDSICVIDQLFSGLVELGLDHGVVPDVAHSWELSEGGLTYTFHLRDDVYWSDGTPVTALDFEYAWKRVLNPAARSPVASLLYDIKGGRAFHQGNGHEAEVEVRALDARTLVVELERPTGHFLHLLAHTASFPVPKKVVAVHSEAWTKAQNIVTNGPFCLESHERKKGLALVRNPNYHGRFTGNVGRIELCVGSDISNRMEMYQTNKLDTLFLWSHSDERNRARQQHADEYVSAPWLATTYLGFDAGRPPFNDPDARRAFVLTIDREALANVVAQGYVFPAMGGFIPPGMPGHSAEIGLPYNPQQGRTLWAAAGYPAEGEFPPIEFLTDHDKDSTSKYLVSQWKKNLGANVAWKAVEWTAFLERLENDPPHVFLNTWVSDFPDPDSYLRVCDAIHWVHWQSEAFDELIQDARQVTDQRQRMAMYCQADKLLVEQAVIAPLTYWRSHMLVKPWVRRFPLSAIKWWYWKDVVIEPHE